MKIDKLKKYETQTAPEPSPESIRADREIVINMLMAIADKMKKNPQPVADSFESLAQQAKTGVIRQPTIIQSGENSAQNVTKIISGNDENSPEIITQIYTDDEIKILNSLK